MMWWRTFFFFKCQIYGQITFLGYLHIFLIACAFSIIINLYSVTVSMPRVNPNRLTWYFLLTARLIMFYSLPKRWRWGITKMTQQAAENDAKLQTERDIKVDFSISQLLWINTRFSESLRVWFRWRDIKIRNKNLLDKAHFHPSHLYHYEMINIPN